jgi:hypothetical protein
MGESDRKANHYATPTQSQLAQLARRLARTIDPRDPTGSLAGLGVTLRVCERPLRLPSKSVFGAWDPLLRRIELFGCDDTRSDDQIVETLGHELWHALGHGDPAADTEAVARRFARAWLRELGPRRVRLLAAALRSQATRTRASAPEQCPDRRTPRGLKPAARGAGVGPSLVNIGL